MEENEFQKPQEGIVPKTSAEPTGDPTPQPIKWTSTIISIVVILAAAGALFYLLREKDSTADTAVENTPAPQVEIQEQEIPANEASPRGEVVATLPPPPPMVESTPPPVVVPPAQISGASTVSLEWKPTEHATLGFQYIIRGEWLDKVEGNRVTVYNPTTGSIMGTVEMLTQNGITLEALASQMQNSPQIKNIATISKNGQSFLHYNITNSSGYGYATVRGNKVFYIVDFSEGSVVAQSFKAL